MIPETVELGTKAKTNPRKSVQITEELGSESDMDEDLESTRVPKVDRDFNPKDLGPRHPGWPVPGADPEAAFRSGIGRDHVQDQEAFSTASRAVIEKLRLEKEQMVCMLFKVHTDSFDQHDTELLSQHLTEEELDQINANAMRNPEALIRMNLERDLGEGVPANISRE
jgi:hypothetical protein